MKAVDLFSGLGGFSEGARAAGIQVIYAANHWPAAVECHASNHPETRHVCQDLNQADWRHLPRHDLLLAAPGCQGHTPARGKERPSHDGTRATAWAVISCAEVHRPRLVLVENVMAFTRWILYPTWCGAMRALGYTLSPHFVDAADYGVPQNRRRLILICTKSKHPLMLRQRSDSHRPIGPHIQWNRGEWREIDATLKPRTLQRIANGRKRYGERFVAPYYSSGSGLEGRSIERPIGTITTVDRWAAIDGNRTRMINVEECRTAMGFPDSYLLPKATRLAKHLLGNAVCPPMITAILNELREAA